jgi:hypothetical protein
MPVEWRTRFGVHDITARIGRGGRGAVHCGADILLDRDAARDRPRRVGHVGVEAGGR